MGGVPHARVLLCLRQCLVLAVQQHPIGGGAQLSMAASAAAQQLRADLAAAGFDIDPATLAKTATTADEAIASFAQLAMTSPSETPLLSSHQRPRPGHASGVSRWHASTTRMLCREATLAIARNCSM